MPENDPFSFALRHWNVFRVWAYFVFNSSPLFFFLSIEIALQYFYGAAPCIRVCACLHTNELTDLPADSKRVPPQHFSKVLLQSNQTQTHTHIDINSPAHQTRTQQNPRFPSISTATFTSTFFISTSHTFSDLRLSPAATVWLWSSHWWTERDGAWRTWSRFHLLKRSHRGK